MTRFKVVCLSEKGGVLLPNSRREFLCPAEDEAAAIEQVRKSTDLGEFRGVNFTATEETADPRPLAEAIEGILGQAPPEIAQEVRQHLAAVERKKEAHSRN